MRGDQSSGERHAPSRPGLRALARRGWVILAAALAVTAIAYAFAGGTDRPYTAESVTVVQSGASGKGPGAANDAATLASTYAAVIPADTEVSRYVARRLDVSTNYVNDHVSVVTDSGTSIVRLRFRDENRQRALDGATALARAVTSERPVTEAIERRSLVLVRLPEPPERANDAQSTVLPIALALGLLLGLTLFVAWERADRRVDDVGALAGELNTPASAVWALSPTGATALVERWRSLVRRTPVRVAIIPATRKLAPLAADAARTLARRLPAGYRGVVVDSYPPRESEDIYDGARDEIRLVVGGAPGTDAAGEGAAISSDLTVLVAAPGTSARDIREAVGVLEQFGAGPDWALLHRKDRGFLRMRGPATVEQPGRPKITAQREEAAPVPSPTE